MAELNLFPFLLIAGSKYAVDKTVELHSTPYEERLERALQEEELALARRREQRTK
jgi:hypothetical protein